MVKFFQLKATNGWSDCSFKELLTLLKDMLPQGNTVPGPFMRQNRYSVRWVWRWRKSTLVRIIAFYIVDLSTKTSRNAIFVDSTDSIIEKTAVMMRTTTETEEKTSLKRCFDTFLSFLV
jgi:hypothetical protein